MFAFNCTGLLVSFELNWPHWLLRIIPASLFSYNCTDINVCLELYQPYCLLIFLPSSLFTKNCIGLVLFVWNCTGLIDWSELYRPYCLLCIGLFICLKLNWSHWLIGIVQVFLFSLNCTWNLFCLELNWPQNINNNQITFFKFIINALYFCIAQCNKVWAAWIKFVWHSVI